MVSSSIQEHLLSSEHLSDQVLHILPHHVPPFSSAPFPGGTLPNLLRHSHLIAPSVSSSAHAGKNNQGSDEVHLSQIPSSAGGTLRTCSSSLSCATTDLRDGYITMALTQGGITLCRGAGTLASGCLEKHSFVIVGSWKALASLS